MKKRPSLHALRRTGAGLSFLLAFLAPLGAEAAAGPAPRISVAPPPSGGPARSLQAAASAARPPGPPVFQAAASNARAATSRRPLAVPLRRIDRAHRRAVRSIMESPTLIRRLPVRHFHSDKTTYEYLLDNLSVSSRLSGLLGYGAYRITEVEEGRFHGKDFSGVEGDFWIAYADTGICIYLGEGSYNSWYTPKISAKVLLVLDFAETRPGEMTTKIDIYVSTNRLVGYLMEFMGSITDKKLSQLVSSAQYTSEMLSSYPRRVWSRMISSNLFTSEELQTFRRVFLIPPGGAGGSSERGTTSRRSGLPRPSQGHGDL